MRKICMWIVSSVFFTYLVGGADWTVSSESDWQKATEWSKNLVFENGLVIPKNTKASSSRRSVKKTSFSFQSTIKYFDRKRKATAITFKQSDAWENWTEVPHVGPSHTGDAPVFLAVEDGEYWYFARYHRSQEQARKNKENEVGGYDVWHSTDMKNWTHYGPVSDWVSRWVTTAEYVDGKFYIYYDNPNDEDPHLIIDSDLTDGKMGENIGMVFQDPSHGSDCAILRDRDGWFHLIYEDWTPINAREHAWDSPLAGHALSRNGIDNFQILSPAVDYRTTPTGEVGTHGHPHWDDRLAEYQVHRPVQDAFGDWCAIKVGEQYYLFGDYDSAEHSQGAGNTKKYARAHMSIARFTSDSMDKPFKFVGDFGQTGHPDPDIGFAEGQFYLFKQSGETDFISPGPWVDGVEVRVGVDIHADREIDQWTDWTAVKETYDHTPGFVRIIQRIPARLDLSELCSGYGFKFEFRLRSQPDTKVMPVMDQVVWSFLN